ncbi:MAG: hypothetical protein ABEJ77_05525 [Halanaeroarchaeum sp.]
MLEKLGALGVLGLVAMVLGLGLVAVADPLVAAGLFLVLAGTGLLVKRGLDQVMGLFGM